MVDLPSIKLPRPTVISSGTDDKTEIAHLRARLAELERTDEDRAREEAERYVAALRNERMAATIRLAECERHDPDTHEQIEDPFSMQGGNVSARLSWGQRAAQHRTRIAAIDAEIRRVTQPAPLA